MTRVTAVTTVSPSPPPPCPPLFPSLALSPGHSQSRPLRRPSLLSLSPGIAWHVPRSKRHAPHALLPPPGRSSRSRRVRSCRLVARHMTLWHLPSAGGEYTAGPGPDDSRGAISRMKEPSGLNAPRNSGLRPTATVLRAGSSWHLTPVICHLPIPHLASGYLDLAKTRRDETRRGIAGLCHPERERTGGRQREDGRGSREPTSADRRKGNGERNPNESFLVRQSAVDT
ncbi:hypothetical protein M427DRAFT_246786 [Gonapodya prolifera JEL478]|uniref:Uncharacterized protein n=1 Tax=Gonapodya prolifera (strain JEL478) TaxID=1344416 RepID=A0A139AM40_GONPJ|nr:hypothetical protein M427DRAFT_246786 [Gonapodya prolifera JEL478]|eukprot:KXS17821.1 hypothetical protein M427DRAFT_246786 [Gonapodya prolifera JEL478]